MFVGNIISCRPRTLASMKIRDIPTFQLRQILRETERLAGSDSVEVRILRRELARRKLEKAEGRHAR